MFIKGRSDFYSYLTFPSETRREPHWFENVQGCLLLDCVSIFGKKCSAYIVATKWIWFSTKALIAPCYPIILCEIMLLVPEQWKKSRIYLLLFDTRNLIWFLCSSRQVIGLYLTPTRALILVKQLHLIYCYVYGFNLIWKILSVYTYKSCWLEEELLLLSKCES